MNSPFDTIWVGIGDRKAATSAGSVCSRSFFVSQIMSFLLDPRSGMFRPQARGSCASFGRNAARFATRLSSPGRTVRKVAGSWATSAGLSRPHLGRPHLGAVSRAHYLTALKVWTSSLNLPRSVLYDRQRQPRAAPHGVLHTLPQRLGRVRILDLQSVVVVDHEDFRHEPRAHGVALAQRAVHDHSHAVLLWPGLDRV